MLKARSGEGNPFSIKWRVSPLLLAEDLGEVKAIKIVLKKRI